MFRLAEGRGPRHAAGMLGTRGPLLKESILPHLWHGGCRVHAGEKLLLIVFKALPPPPPMWATALRTLVGAAAVPLS